LLTSLVAAWEINSRVIISQQPSPERFQQVYGVCQHESLGAAVAYGLLRGCDAAGLENSLGLAASLTPLPTLHKYNWQARPLVSFKDYNAPAAEPAYARWSYTSRG
jgi:2-methylcitrate dehydratase PrpD